MENAEIQTGNTNYQNPDNSASQPSVTNQYPRIIRLIAYFFSYLLHPIFITSYVIYFLIFVHPLAFAGFNKIEKVFWFFRVFFVDTFLPIFSTFLLLQLRLGVQSLQLRTQKERIIPYAIAMIYYWWAWHVSDNFNDSPVASVHFLLSSFLAVCGAWFCNIYFKVSMHAIAMGGLVMFFILFSFTDSYASGLYLSLAFLIAGIVCTSRLILAAHTYPEIYLGFFIGVLSQFIAWQF